MSWRPILRPERRGFAEFGRLYADRVRFAQRRARGRRTWPQRLLLSFNIVLVLVALSAAAVLGYGYEKAGSFPRVALPPGLLRDAESAAGEAMNVLLVGTDSSDGLDEDDPIQIGRSPSSDLADVIMILRLDPENNDAALLSLPRDLWVPIAGTNQPNKINSAYSVGGASTLIETIQEYLGIPIHHFVAVDFAGFQKVVSAIGGVELYFPYPARDLASGLDVPEAGCQLLDPVQALAYSRSRQYQNQIDGRWQPDNEADFGRMRRQQEFMRRALSRAIDRGARNPVTLNALLNAVDDALLLDDQLTVGQIIDIAYAFRLFNPESLQSYTLGDFVSSQMIRGQSALLLNESDADPILDLFRGERGLDPTPETVRVRVLNGSGVANQAWDVAQALQQVGFTVRGSDNLRGGTLDRTEIRYLPGQRAHAELLARYLVVQPGLVEDLTLRQAPVELVTGSDYRGLVEPGSSGEDTTTTSQAGAPTATSSPTTSTTESGLDGTTDTTSAPQPPPQC
jgi:polyisoprenyl-teichoic acid--peptidoglycan teichoic acid transferase